MYKKRKKGQGMAIGIILGTTIGVLLDNIGTWIAIGIAFGAGLEHRLNQAKPDDSQVE